MAEASVRTGHFGAEQARRIGREVYGLETSATPLPGYDSENHRLQGRDGRAYVLKISPPDESPATVEAQMAAMRHITARGDARQSICPLPCPTVSGADVGSVVDDRGSTRHVQLLTWVAGDPLARVQPKEEALLVALGRFFGSLDASLQDFSHPGVRHTTAWDLKSAVDLARHTRIITDPAKRRIVDTLLLQHELYAAYPMLRQRASVIHGDGNDYNVLVCTNGHGPPRVSGVIDFGDMVFAHPICELAIVIAYAILDCDAPLPRAAQVVRGYHEALPLTEDEVDILFHLICARLCISVTHAARAASRAPHNPYVTVSEAGAWRALSQLVKTSPDAARDVLRQSCRLPSSRPSRQKRELTAARRRQHLPQSLRLGFREPIEMTRGALQYLFDAEGRVYLDAYNNVPHVGHCHPRVVRATLDASARLNTNTRYLSACRAEYVGRLLATFPESLDVCVLLCSGSEANDLARRMALAHTGRDAVVVVDGAYHGITASAMQLSPYKWRNRDGAWAPGPSVRVVPTPDGYRGKYRGNDEATGIRYANDVGARLEQMASQDEAVGAFFCESLLGCAGQVDPPPGYLREVYRHVRRAGGVCVADEVQVGFGRVGTHFWGFQAHDAVPDIVTIGKPMGNGHPMAAVVTTRAIARSFDRLGIELFSTYGGNTVSCAVGLAVLDVLEDEHLQQHARQVGEHLRSRLRGLQQRHPLIGDVRGRGLFVGVELVRDRTTLEPAAPEASTVVEAMKAAGVLCGVDGPLCNVLKIKPPMVFNREDADRFVVTLDRALLDLS